MVKFSGLHLRNITRVEVVRCSQFGTLDIRIYGETPWDYETITLWGAYDKNANHTPPEYVGLNMEKQAA